MSEIESAVTKSIWLGSLPIILTLSDTDNTTARDPLHLIALRCAYLPLYSSLIRTHFLIDESTELWFSSNHLALKWHYPIGLLHDILTHTPLPSASSSAASLTTTTREQPAIPWSITLHVSSFPSDKVFKSLPTASLMNDPPRDFFMNSLKESEFIRNLTTKKVMSLSKPDQMLLWDSLSESAALFTPTTNTTDAEYREKLVGWHDKFWSVNSKLLGSEQGAGALPTPDVTTPTGNSFGRSVAVRLYLGWDKPVCQDLVAPGPDVTLLHALRILVPNLVPESVVSTFDTEVDQMTSQLNALEVERESPKPTFKIISHGVSVPLETPLLWLARHFSYPDDFLHLVLEIV
ncbi:autophagy protein 5 [Podochytrium sp. JEL0797]|nr:autophagy protein 5 [Podochytrium sp. JEL0797]